MGHDDFTAIIEAARAEARENRRKLRMLEDQLWLVSGSFLFTVLWALLLWRL